MLIALSIAARVLGFGAALAQYVAANEMDDVAALAAGVVYAGLLVAVPSLAGAIAGQAGFAWHCCSCGAEADLATVLPFRDAYVTGHVRRAAKEALRLIVDRVSPDDRSRLLPRRSGKLRAMVLELGLARGEALPLDRLLSCLIRDDEAFASCGDRHRPRNHDRGAPGRAGGVQARRSRGSLSAVAIADDRFHGPAPCLERGELRDRVDDLARRFADAGPRD